MLIVALLFLPLAHPLANDGTSSSPEPMSLKFIKTESLEPQEKEVLDTLIDA